MRGRWNHNTHYHRLVLKAVPKGAETALDVGCGEGDLLFELSRVVPGVVGVDTDAVVLGRAAAAAPRATLEHGNFLTHPFRADSFDLVAAVASVHHMDLTTALARISELVRPGGAAVVVGLARPGTATDHLIEAAGAVASRVMRLFVGYKEVRAPTLWPPPLTYEQCRRIGVDALPGAVFRRRLFFRYSLVWKKPSDSG